MLYELRLLISVPRLRLRNNVCASTPPSPPPPTKIWANKRRCVWGSPYYAHENMCSYFSFPPFWTVVPSVFCLVSPNGIAWVCAVRRCSHSPLFAPSGTQQRTVPSEWPRFICIRPAPRGLEDACVGTRITAGWKQHCNSACDLASDVAWLSEIGEQQK